MAMEPHIITPAWITPRWFTLAQASMYSGLGTRVLQNYIREELIRSSNVCSPGTSRGRRLINRESLDAFIEAGVGKKTSLEMNRVHDGKPGSSLATLIHFQRPNPYPPLETLRPLPQF